MGRELVGYWSRVRLRLFVLWVLTGCGRLGFDSTSPLTGGDGGTDTAGNDTTVAPLTIDDPPENAEVGSTAHLVGACAAGQQLDFTGGGLAMPSTTSCAVGGTFGADVAFTAGFGPKLVIVSQTVGGVTTHVMRNFLRVAAAISFRSSRSAQTQSAGFMVDCDLLIGRPMGVVDDDLLIGMIFTDASGPITTPGFTRLQAAGAGFAGFFKVARSEPDHYLFHIVAGANPSDTCGAGAVIVAFRNVDPASPIEDQSNTSSLSATSIIAPSVTATSPTMLVAVFGSNGPSQGITAPAAMTIRADAMPAGSFAISLDGFGDALVAWQLADNGVTGPRTATIPTAADVGGGLVALRPR